MIKNFKKNKNNTGFTLIELMVVVFIFLIITSITIFNYGKFNSSVSIQNLADDIALSVRSAQSYAIGVRGANDIFSFGYGVHFSTKQVNPGQEFYGSNKSFVLFADISDVDPNAVVYDHDESGKCGTPVAGNECMEVLNILTADQIESISLIIDGTPTSVSSNGTVDVWFKRPNPEPNFCYRSNGGTGSCDESSNISAMKIRMSNIINPAIFKIITISNNGQISVANNAND